MMKNLAATFCIVCGLLFIYGFFLADRVRITVRDIKGRPDIDVIVTVPRVTEDARWVALFGCAAEMDDNNRIFCVDGWEFQSTHPMRPDQRQYPFLIRSAPRGWLLFIAAVTNQNGDTLASGDTRVVR